MIHGDGRDISIIMGVRGALLYWGLGIVRGKRERVVGIWDMSPTVRGIAVTGAVVKRKREWELNVSLIISLTPLLIRLFHNS